VEAQGRRTAARQRNDAVSLLLAATMRADAARGLVAEHAATIARQRSLLAGLSRPSSQLSNHLLRDRVRLILVIAQRRMVRAALELRRAENRVAVARCDLAEIEAGLGLPPATDRRCIRCGGTGRYSFRGDVREMCLRCSGSGIDPGPQATH
jgi:RNA:NAD 2'-phosphotransferase (TPT1/KptA family)